MKDEIYQAILDDVILRAKIADKINVHIQTIVRYANRKSERLETFKIQRILREYLGIEQLEKEEEEPVC
jgi:ribosome-binding protein aMBF1 (putative translation factor)